MPSRAESLLSSVVTFRDAATRDAPVPTTFASGEEAVQCWFETLLHEAHEAMTQPLERRPTDPYLHPVDLDTQEPGIVADVRDDVQILRKKDDAIRRVVYRGAPSEAPPPPPEAVFDRTAARAAVEEEIRKAHSKTLQKAERRAASSQQRQEKLREEDPEDRRLRLQEAKRKREERKLQPPPTPKPPKPPPPPPSEEALVVPDTSAAALVAPARRVKRGKGKEQFFGHPIPHDRHLTALQHAAPSANILPALLRGETCEALEVIQGPPGTGKTRELVRRLEGVEGRVLLCAPTNVGAANLYARCVDMGYADATALVMAADRVPPGTVVLCNDPSRRFVCATISARAGGALTAQAFATVFVDEAAQTTEALVWTLLRADVQRLVLAGDVKQLPAIVSESGKALAHERSLMQRLTDLSYANVTSLTVQNRMAPSLLAFPNATFYDGALTTGPHAPTEGAVVVVTSTGTEDTVGTSHRNRDEAEAVAAYVRDHPMEDTVLLTPYLAQCEALLARKTGLPIHTVDSFQGREAARVVLSVVRDGSNGMGFWDDDRRAVVALTRARVSLVVVASHVANWPRASTLRRLVETAAR